MKESRDAEDDCKDDSSAFGWVVVVKFVSARHVDREAWSEYENIRIGGTTKYSR